MQGRQLPRRKMIGVAAGAASLTLLAVGFLIVPAIADEASTAEEIEQLNERYAALEDAIPEGPKSGPNLTALNEEYEKEFAQIGPGDLPNGPNPSLTADEHEPNLVPEGLHEAIEHPPGYVLTNYWASSSGSDSPIFVAGASVEHDASVGGVYVVTSEGEAFLPAPSKTGPLTIESVSGTVMKLTMEGGVTLSFDYAAMKYGTS